MVNASISEANIVRMAIVAKNYSSLDPARNVSTAVLKICAKFIAATFKTAWELAEFLGSKVTENKEQEDLVKLYLINTASSLGEGEWKKCCDAENSLKAINNRG